MAVDTHHVVAYDMNVQQLAGFQWNSPIVPHFRQASEKGEIASFDCIGADPASANDGATETAWADVPAYADFINAGTGTFADFLATRTPHDEVLKVRSLVSPKQIEWGYSFRKKDELAELTDPTGRVMRNGGMRMQTSTDKYALAALTATTVLRGKSADTASAVAMPAGQILTSATAKTYTTADGRAIARLFEENYMDVAMENIYAIISPEMKQVMRNADASLSSRDFIDSYAMFRDGTLPKVDGITYIVHPRIKSYIGAGKYDRVVAFTSEGMVWNSFSDVESNLAENPDARFEPQAYMRQFCNAVRVDDKRVVWMDINIA